MAYGFSAWKLLKARQTAPHSIQNEIWNILCWSSKPIPQLHNRTWEVLLPNQKQGSVGRDESSWESQAGTINFKLCRRVYFSAFPPLSIVNIDTAYFFIALYELIWHVVVSDFEKAFRFDYGWNLFWISRISLIHAKREFWNFGLKWRNYLKWIAI